MFLAPSLPSLDGEKNEGPCGECTHTVYLFSVMADSDLSLELLELQKTLKKAANMVSHLPSVSLRVFLAIPRAKGEVREHLDLE